MGEVLHGDVKRQRLPVIANVVAVRTSVLVEVVGVPARERGTYRQMLPTYEEVRGR